MTDYTMPPDVILVDDDGQPISHIDLVRLTADARQLAYEMAATAGDDDATTQVCAKWASDPDYFGYLCIRALLVMTRSILAPALEAAAGIDPGGRGDAR